MPYPSFALEVVAVAGLLTLVLLVWRYERRCSGLGPLCDPASDMDLVATPSDQRGNRAIALMLAATAWKGDPASVEDILSLADEFLQYLEGDDAVMPRPDKLSKGYIPR